MFDNYLYLFIDIGTILIPFIFSFHPTLQFYLSWKAFISANAIVTLAFILWDMLFTHLGIWGFNPRYLCGLYILNLPLEEILFFFCIPYASLFTYHCFNLFFSKLLLPVRVISIVLILLLSLFGTAFFFHAYTSVTFLSLAILLLYFTFFLKPGWLSNFYLSYIAILLPFFVVNGLLTGSWIQEPVVWYNNNENLGIRLFTIPVEDIFYGMLMLMLNTWLYERFKHKYNL